MSEHSEATQGERVDSRKIALEESVITVRWLDSSLQTQSSSPGLELSLTAIYPDETLWTIFRNGKELITVAAHGPMSALVRFGAIAAGRYGSPETRDYNADWTVERAT